MLTKIKTLNLILTQQHKLVYSNIRGGMKLSVKFKRNLSENTIYKFVGICIKVHKNSISSSIILRNVISLYPIEYTFNLHSPLVQITALALSKNLKTKLKNKSKLYYLRKKPAPISRINFKYVN